MAGAQLWNTCAKLRKSSGDNISTLWFRVAGMELVGSLEELLEIEGEGGVGCWRGCE
jgi:hypothetical protein